MECFHKWIVTTTEGNRPEDVMCSECKEVAIMIEYKDGEVIINEPMLQENAKT